MWTAHYRQIMRRQSWWEMPISQVAVTLFLTLWFRENDINWNKIKSRIGKGLEKKDQMHLWSNISTFLNGKKSDQLNWVSFMLISYTRVLQFLDFCENLCFIGQVTGSHWRAIIKQWVGQLELVQAFLLQSWSVLQATRQDTCSRRRSKRVLPFRA